MVEGRGVMGRVAPATTAPIFRSFRSSSVHLVHLPFTFYACGLFASNRLSRNKTPVCVTTILVRVVTLSALVARDRVGVFGVIATFSLCCSCLVGSVYCGDFGPVCYTRVDESSKTIAA